MGTILGLLLAFIIPLLFLGIIRKFDFYQTGQYRYIILCLVWGGIAYFLAVFTNRLIVGSGLATWDTVIRFSAPITEEFLKALFLLFLVQRPQFTYSVDGAVYGFASGIGFAVFENYEYVTSTPEIALAVALQRVFSTNLIHASSSAIVGITLGVFRLETTRSRWMILLAGIVLAIGQHMLFNNMVSRGTYLVVAVGAGLVSTAYIYYSIRRGIQNARGWIKEKLGMDDRVTSGEAALVNHLESADEILAPIADRFGAEKASQVEVLLFLQARLGIKRKTLDSFQENEKMRHAVETEMSEMRAQMEGIRRAIGTYVMLFVRGTYTEDVISVWDQMQAKIQAQSAETKGQKGGGLWSSLDNRLNQPVNHEGIED